MKKLCILALAVIALVGLTAPPELFAQAAAPQPTFSITGLMDNVGTWAQNVSNGDNNLNRNRDSIAYGRTRGIFNIIGQAGAAKAVGSLEIDGYWGQTGFTGSNNSGTGCVVTATGTNTCGQQGNGAQSSFPIQTDQQGFIKVKWLYTEFPMPLTPIPTIVRLGAQPFATAASNKLAVYANGDFAGVNLYTTFSPTFKLQLTYVALDESLFGAGANTGSSGSSLPFSSSAGNLSTSPDKCINTAGTTTQPCQPQTRGDNFAVILSPELTPMKGLTVKPMYSYIFINGQTGGARQGRGGIVSVTSQATESPFAPSVHSIDGADGSGTGTHENRHTVGVDSSWRSGAWAVDPSAYYQFGSQQKWLMPGVLGADPFGAGSCTAGTPAAGTVLYGGCKKTADISAWLVDVRGSYQWGPLLLSSMVLYTSGQAAKISPYRAINYYTPLGTDTSYAADWGTQIFSLGVDYYNILNGTSNAGLNPGTAIGYDKYGRIQFGAKASYALTPSVTFGAAITPNWTDKKVDTNSILVGGGGLLPSYICRTTAASCRPEGTSDYLGTEFNLALTYRFAPGLVFDWAVGYLAAGNALGHRAIQTGYCSGGTIPGNCTPIHKDIGVQDAAISAVRVRMTW